MADAEPQRLFYRSRPVPESHPNRLATIARLHGMQPAVNGERRVLELGCANGGNLIPLAEIMPEVSFIGVDLAGEEIAAGNQRIAELGLSNIRLLATDIRAIDASWGYFDFILCHGVFSWVSPEIREKLFDVAAANLTENGVVYLNINTHPGWNTFSLIRDIFARAAAGFSTPEDRIAAARKAARLFQSVLANQPHAYARQLVDELKNVSGQSDSYLYHAFLEVANEPIHFDRFVAQAGRHGLQYLGDSRSGLRWSRPLLPAMELPLHESAAEPVAREQLLDFMTSRASRFCLLCSAKLQLLDSPPPESLDGIFLASAVQKQSSLTGPASRPLHVFTTAGGKTFSTDSGGLSAALEKLGTAWPAAIDCGDLLKAACDRSQAGGELRLRQELLEAYFAELIELNVAPPCCIATIEPCPRVSRSAQLDAAAGEFVVNLKHRSLPLNDLARAFIQRLDGQTPVVDLSQWLEQSARDPSCSFAATVNSLLVNRSPWQVVGDLLGELRRNAFLLR